MESESDPCDTFLERKLRAFGVFGKPPPGLEEEYREFVAHRRQLNTGRFNDFWKTNPKRKDISESVFPHEILGLNVWDPKFFIQETYRRFKAVYDCTTFKDMFHELKQQKEFAIVLKTECNEHSFVGMTTMIQISTWQVDYVIDVLPLNRFIMEDLKTVLEDSKILKYIFDGDNVVMKLKRDFLINMVHACDVQILMQLVLKVGVLKELFRNIPLEIKKPWYLKVIGKRHSLVGSCDPVLWEMQASETPLNFETVRDLFCPEVKLDTVDKAMNSKLQFTTLENQNSTVIDYKHAFYVKRNNSNALLSIVSFVKGNVLSMDMKKLMFGVAYEDTKLKLTKIFSPTFPITFDFYPFSENAIDIPLEHVPLFRTIYNWRRHHAAIIDEYPPSLFSDEQILDFIENKPTSIEEIASRVSKKHTRTGSAAKLTAEYHLSWSKTLLGILQEGESHFHKLMSLECHNCLKARGHIAWGCPELPNKERLKTQKHLQSKRIQNNQQQLNKRMKV